MSRGYSTPCAREIGAALRKQREQAGLSSAALARALDWAQSKLSRVQSGIYPVSEGEVSLYRAGAK